LLPVDLVPTITGGDRSSTGIARADSTCNCEACKAHPRSAAAAEHRKVCRAITGLDEKHARRVVGLLASMKGHGGNALLSTITGMSRTTILQGQHELVGSDSVPQDRVRRPRRWAKVARKKRPALTRQLHQVLEGTIAGDPMSTVKWTRKSTRCVSRALRVSHTKARACFERTSIAFASIERTCRGKHVRFAIDNFDKSTDSPSPLQSADNPSSVWTRRSVSS